MSALPTKALRSRRSRRSRGYSLVEIMIVLVASALLASGPILLLYNKVLADDYESTKRQLALVKGKVVEYAATRRTAARLLHEAGDTNNVRWRTADGRPYLPCPDVDGDGIEDRSSAMRPAGTPFYDADRALDAYECASPLGFLPHETLGTRPTDPWGNRLIYAVDLVLSNPLVGLDGLSRPSSYDERSGATYDATDERLEYPLRSDKGLALPPMLCIGHPTTAADDACSAGDLQGEVVPGTDTLTLTGPDGVQRVFVSTDATTPIEGQSVIEGLAFAIISAGRYEQGPLYFDPSNCGGTAPGGISGDAYNYGKVSGWLCSGTPPTPPTSPLLYAVREPAAFGAGATAFRSDDLAEWMSAAEVAASLAELGTFPVREFPLVISDDESVRGDRSRTLRALRPSLVTVSASRVRLAMHAEALPFLLLDELEVTLPPGDYLLESQTMTSRADGSAFQISCVADALVATPCVIAPPGGVEESTIELSLAASGNLDVTLDFGVFPLRLVTDSLPGSANTDLAPW